MVRKYDYLIIGSGIIGLAVAREIRQNRPNARLIIIEKETKEAAHASSRNSGVLHAGFYYTADTLKAKFTVAGNHALRAYCQEKGIAVNACGKLVVAQDEQELEKLYELERRGKNNGSRVEIIDEARALEIEPNVRTFKKALYSPDTASVNPAHVCAAIKEELESNGVEFRFSTRYLSHKDNVVLTNEGGVDADRIINCAGLYADKIANDFGFGRNYTIIPFKGLYLKYTKNKTDVRTNIYPVPNLKNPFLGVHFTKTVDNEIKIGPTAIPAFWRENYDGLSNFHLSEFKEIIGHEAQLFLANSFGFRDLAFEEMRKYDKTYFIGLAQKMVRSIDPNGFTQYTMPGIRAQLLDLRTRRLIQDFLIEGDARSIHILNAVSPAFTCSFPFARHVVDHYI